MSIELTKEDESPSHSVGIMPLASGAFSVPPQLEAEIDALITHYPIKRSASLMVLHALQEHFGYLTSDAIEWTAAMGQFAILFENRFAPSAR